MAAVSEVKAEQGVSELMPRPINVLHVIDSLAPGGAERVVVELVNNLDKRIVAPSVCVTRADTTLAGAIQDGIPVFRLNRQGTWDRRGLSCFGGLVRHNSIDIIHAHGYSSSLFVAVAKAYNLLNVPIIMHAHSSNPPGLATRLVARTTVKHFIGVSPQSVRWAQSLMGFPVQQTTLLGNAINIVGYFDSAPIDLRPYFEVRPRFVGIVLANVRPVKDFDTLFHALAASSYRDEIGVVVAGSVADSDYVEHCCHLLTDLDLAERVVFLGSRQDVSNLLASTDFALLSSENESGPIALLEYMAAALPFVVTRVGQVGEAVATAGLPSVVPKRDPACLADALDRLLLLPIAERKARGLAGREFLVKNFSIDVRVQCLQDIYRSLVKNHKGSYAKAEE